MTKEKQEKRAPSSEKVRAGISFRSDLLKALDKYAEEKHDKNRSAAVEAFDQSIVLSTI